jgi:hypothetical protein
MSGEDNSVSRLEAALKRRADRAGKSVREFLDEDLMTLRQSTYPGPECLSPHEVERFFSLELGDDRVSHVEKCPMCSGLLDAARPTDYGVARLIEECRRANAAVSIAGHQEAISKDRIPRPLVDVTWLVASVLLALITLGTIVVSQFSDVIFSSLLSTIALRLSLIVIVAALLAVLLTYTKGSAG